jgi:hypothetical protein
MGMPLLIGAGVGALGAAAMGKSPFTGALLGGSLGMGASALGAGSLLGSAAGGASEGVSLGAMAAPTVGETAAGIPSTAIGTAGAPSMGINFANTGGMGVNLASAPASSLSGLNYAINPATVSVAGNAPALASSGSLLGNAANSIWDWTKNNPSTALQGVSAANNMLFPQAHPMQVQGGGVKAGNPNLAANIPEMLQISNVAPQVLPDKSSKLGMANSLNAQDILKRIPISQLFNQESI